MSASNAAERQLVAQIAAHTSWANTTNRTARTAPARAALDAKFLTEADGDPVRAEHLKKAHYKRLALKSAQARRAAQNGSQGAQNAQNGSQGSQGGQDAQDGTQGPQDAQDGTQGGDAE